MTDPLDWPAYPARPDHGFPREECIPGQEPLPFPDEEPADDPCVPLC